MGYETGPSMRNAYAYFPLNAAGNVIFTSAPCCDHSSGFSLPSK